MNFEYKRKTSLVTTVVLATAAFFGCGSYDEGSGATKMNPAKNETPNSRVANSESTEDLVKKNHGPFYVTEYDLMTPEDEFYFHHLKDLCSGGDLAKWPLVQSMVKLGKNFVDANLLATLANETIYISDQPRAAPIIKIVKECAALLQVDAPEVFIDGNPEPDAYVARMGEPQILVLTSGLLDLYSERPEELRFIIGHELGHLKMKHLKTHFLGRFLVNTIVGDKGSSATFKDDFVAAVSIGCLLHWYRESEYSADRAGLLCIGGNLNVAKQALLRLLHQTKPSNPLMDPSHPDFDVDLVMKKQIQLRDEPFVKIISYFRQWREAHPFIPERCAALHQWSLTSEFQTILERPQLNEKGLVLELKSIQINKIPKVDTYLPYYDSGATDPLVNVTHAGVTKSTGHGVDMESALWKLNPTLVFDHAQGAGVVLELFDYNAARGKTLVGSCFLPIDTRTAGGTLKTDLRLDVFSKSTIVDLPKVSVEYLVRQP